MAASFFFSHAVNKLLLAQGTEKKIPLLHKSISGFVDHAATATLPGQ